MHLRASLTAEILNLRRSRENGIYRDINNSVYCFEVN
nr:MAG TPA: hypothetical protein [Caudoviricetes sp.]